ncbi:TPA: hypothetical protein DDZ06_04910 [Candidatus Uhrbacteria bacterium]|nr:hypothetical protein [Candidatus Uhrbacteria bacterium]
MDRKNCGKGDKKKRCHGTAPSLWKPDPRQGKRTTRQSRKSDRDFLHRIFDDVKGLGYLLLQRDKIHKFGFIFFFLSVGKIKIGKNILRRFWVCE